MKAKWTVYCLVQDWMQFTVLPKDAAITWPVGSASLLHGEYAVVQSSPVALNQLYVGS